MIQTKPSWFSRKEVFKNVWALSDHGWDTAYLVVGTKHALLIDTTWGIGDLLAVVRAITPLPLSVVLTHGHADHVSGSRQFDKVHINRNDIKLLRESFLPATRQRLSMSFSKVIRSQGISPAEWGTGRLGKVVTVADGFKFNLGNRTIEVITSPGHTAGCIALIDRMNGLLFTGDSILEGDIFLHTPGSLSLKSYCSTLEKLLRLAPSIHHILPGHNKTPISPLIISQLAALTGDLLSGKRKGRPFQRKFRKAVTGNAALIIRGNEMNTKETEKMAQ